MAYLSKPTKKKNKRIKTPISSGDKKCSACGRQYGLENHHVFGASNKNNSAKYKCMEWLCSFHHRGNMGVHGSNIQLDTKLKQFHQERLERDGMTREEFIKRFGRNYIGG